MVVVAGMVEVLDCLVQYDLGSVVVALVRVGIGRGRGVIMDMDKDSGLTVK